MAEACGVCYRSFLPSRKINGSLKCACRRPFFSQNLTRSIIPTDRDCWIEVPKKFVPHYSSLFGETVTFEGDDGRSYSCSLVGSDILQWDMGLNGMKFEESQEPHKRKRPVSETDAMFGSGRLTGNGYRIENCIHEDWKPIKLLVNRLFSGSSKPEQLNCRVAYC